MALPQRDRLLAWEPHAHLSRIVLRDWLGKSGNHIGPEFHFGDVPAQPVDRVMKVASHVFVHRSIMVHEPFAPVSHLRLGLVSHLRPWGLRLRLGLASRFTLL